jgi:hypothetical protein
LLKHDYAVVIFNNFHHLALLGHDYELVQLQFRDRERFSDAYERDKNMIGAPLSPVNLNSEQETYLERP